LRLDLDNFETRCNTCHQSKTLRETRATGRGIAKGTT
jgi:hypothetical protein